MLVSIIIYCVLGACAGVLAGLLGVGGGIVIVPMLVFTFGWLNFPPEHIMLLALGTSLGSIVFTSISSSLSHSRRGAVDWRAMLRISPGILLGTFCGSHVAAHIPKQALQIIFVVFLVYVVSQMFLGKKPKASRELPGTLGMSAAGLVIGGISSLVGIGGGTLSVPFLVWHNVEMHRAVGTSAAIGFPIALSGFFGYMLAGLSAQNLPPYAAGYVYLPALVCLVTCSMLTAPLGVRISHSLPVPKLKRCFAILLLCVGAKMLLDIF